MNRRDFLASSLAAAGAGALGQGGQARSEPSMPELYELRRYRLRVTMRQQFGDYLRDVSVPALNRAGISPVGVFTVAFGPGNPAFYVLLPHRGIESVATLDERLQADQEYLTKGREHHARPSGDPAYERIDSQLMRAFAGMPKLEKPTGAVAGEGRVFELRTYESHSKAAHRKKVEMFDEGEIAIFRKTGLTPVFFGSNLIGQDLPSLTYLLAFEDLAARERNWGTFVNDPAWKALRSQPGYADTEIVSRIHSFILRPGPGSQI